MRLTDISLVLPVVVALAGVVGAAVVLARGRRKKDENVTTDSWERSEERRRRKEAIYGMASYVLLFCCAGVAAALSFQGLVGFGRENLALTNGWEYLVPFGLDGAAMFCSVLAVREASHGDAALGSRMLVWLFAGAAAWFNWVHAPRGMGHAGAPQFFAGMSLSAAVLFDRALKQTRRAALREQGLVPRPLPQIRVVRWLRAPRETFAAWSLMLLEGVRTLDEAVEEVREDRREKENDRVRRREQEKLDRARLRAINRQHRMWGRRGGRQVEVTAATPPPAQLGSEPAIGEKALEPSGAPEQARLAAASARPALRSADAAGAATGELDQGKERERDFSFGFGEKDKDAEADRPRTIDLTAEDDTLTIPRLDSLEEKLAQIERAFG
ncbi:MULTISPECIES: DUF2637 domain-containing protein [Streptomyces]|uniref:DUF2637 domain-containing protein n=2 Tax=Streptomyces TaxID=1883 RepID=A0ABT9L0G7_9ACTN|nr:MULTISPECIES: DUF2637 domain-containing protein [Streptomyces]MBW8090176.1 DUF2637 domain-containing protein [Streptomyces hygroscopicus subsp. hygroscopicus]MCO8304208.1 DUF2637 domain-containing protein [Streptomyces sp. RKCA744]MDN3056353.1 DUF2637 domain-containing protein [Streptomyces sp. SRF1]MDP9614201.1 hypothetical protein [Streptomyces demainii]GHJ32054.1 membrane protein [Streptomyces hygroscopicus]